MLDSHQPLALSNHVSPGLHPDAVHGAAAEVKFLVKESVATAIEALLRRQLAPDPHGDRELNGAYSVQSVYFDTPDFRTYHRRGKLRSQKYRIRQYGQADWAFLERKTRRGVQVRKERTRVPLAWLSTPLACPAGSEAAWFLKQTEELNLNPICVVSYRRSALIGGCDEGPLRATFDRMLQGHATAQWRGGIAGERAWLLPGEVIVELKFLVSMPMVFKCVLQELQLAPATVSKYRGCIDALGLAPAVRHSDLDVAQGRFGQGPPNGATGGNGPGGNGAEIER